MHGLQQHSQDSYHRSIVCRLAVPSQPQHAALLQPEQFWDCSCYCCGDCQNTQCSAQKALCWQLAAGPGSLAAVLLLEHTVWQ